MRLLALSLLLLCACNSPPKNSCATPSNAIGASGQAASTCDLCVDAGSLGLFCLIDCTDGGNVCEPGTEVCVSGAPLSPKSFCSPTCSGPDAAVTECPSPLTCGDAGACVP